HGTAILVNGRQMRVGTARTRQVSPGRMTCVIETFRISMTEEANVRPMHIALLVTAIGMATAADAQRRPIVTWGKAGVSFDQYRADSIACASEAVNLDVSNTVAAQRLGAASPQA